MSAPAIALVVVACLVYLWGAVAAGALMSFAFMDGTLFDARWPIGVLTVLVALLWPVLLALAIVFEIVMLPFG